ncbi:MAG: myo-inosose-2 dehydratase [Rhizobiales bacterium 65-9]|nr:myo-inosose-2 dehydratase [Hyphomicrobiales bacterium]OJY38201.1 MAG: myo-inosose-2 dehydratase [Rhizobiales bacterium 65-9]
MPIRIGANPIAWSNDDDQTVGGDTPLDICLLEAQEAGFAGMELGHKFPRVAAELKAALEPFRMACIGGWHSIELLTRDAKEEFALSAAHRKLLKAMGTPVFIVAETSNAIHGRREIPLSQRPVLPAEEWKPYGARMSELAAMLRDDGFQLVYHYHMGTIVQSREDIARFADSTSDATHFVLDTGHATWGGSDPAEIARSYRSRISHIHTKDVREPIMREAAAKDWSFLHAILGDGQDLGVYTVPGDGMIDFAAVFRELDGYKGWVVVEAEQDPKKASALPYAKKGVAHLKKVFADTGFTLA